METRNLVFIRHSQSRLEAGVPAIQWQLTAEGRRRCIPLATALVPYNLDLVITSTELKAIQTGEIVADRLGIPCQVEQDLHEHERQTAPYFESQTAFQHAVIALFDRPTELIFGEETAQQALERFTGAVEAVLATNHRENIAIVTHGTVLSLFISQLTGCAATPFWRGLGMPAIIVFSLPEMKLLAQVNEIAS
jgi:broad specificity phosphatase PhoE